MRVTVCSIFRNSVGYVDRYLGQIAALGLHVDVRLVATYGDCTDATGDVVAGVARYFDLDLDLERFDHGGPAFGSVDHPDRWDQIAKVVRFTLDRVSDPGDALIWVESDLLWRSDTMLGLLNDLKQVPSVAPRVLANGSDRWYDTWGFRKDGIKFAGHPPYHQGQADPDTLMVKVDSCGSCWVTRSQWWRDWTGHWPFADPDLWLDPTVTVRHP